MSPTFSSLFSCTLFVVIWDLELRTSVMVLQLCWSCVKEESALYLLPDTTQPVMHFIPFSFSIQPHLLQLPRDCSTFLGFQVEEEFVSVVFSFAPLFVSLRHF